ncbi:MAG: DnaT-like ssDNA-binding protein [Pseudomonadota bacterium]
MAIVVEDGTGVAGANSYASVAQLYEYAAARGTLLEVDQETAESLLTRAMDYMEDQFGRRWQGDRASATQELAWPRVNVWVDNIRLDGNSIPRNLQYGQLAAAIEANFQDLQPNPTAAVKRQKVDTIEVEYANNGKRYPVSAFAKPEALLRPLCKHGGLTLLTRA